MIPAAIPLGQSLIPSIGQQIGRAIGSAALTGGNAGLSIPGLQQGAAVVGSGWIIGSGIGGTIRGIYDNLSGQAEPGINPYEGIPGMEAAALAYAAGQGIAEAGRSVAEAAAAAAARARLEEAFRKESAKRPEPPKPPKKENPNPKGFLPFDFSDEFPGEEAESLGQLGQVPGDAPEGDIPGEWEDPSDLVNEGMEEYPPTEFPAPNPIDFPPEGRPESDPISSSPIPDPPEIAPIPSPPNWPFSPAIIRLLDPLGNRWETPSPNTNDLPGPLAPIFPIPDPADINSLIDYINKFSEKTILIFLLGYTQFRHIRRLSIDYPVRGVFPWPWSYFIQEERSGEHFIFPNFELDLFLGQQIAADTIPIPPPPTPGNQGKEFQTNTPRDSFILDSYDPTPAPSGIIAIKPHGKNRGSIYIWDKLKKRFDLGILLKNRTPSLPQGNPSLAEKLIRIFSNNSENINLVDLFQWLKLNPFFYPPGWILEELGVDIRPGAPLQRYIPGHYPFILSPPNTGDLIMEPIQKVPLLDNSWLVNEFPGEEEDDVSVCRAEIIAQTVSATINALSILIDTAVVLRLDGLKDDIAGLNENISGVNENVSTVNANVATLNTNIDSEFSNLNTYLGGAFGTTNQNLQNGFDTTTQNLTSGFSTTNQNLQNGFGETQAKFGEIIPKINSDLQISEYLRNYVGPPFSNGNYPNLTAAVGQTREMVGFNQELLQALQPAIPKLDALDAKVDEKAKEIYDINFANNQLLLASAPKEDLMLQNQEGIKSLLGPQLTEATELGGQNMGELAAGLGISAGIIAIAAKIGNPADLAGELLETPPSGTGGKPPTLFGGMRDIYADWKKKWQRFKKWSYIGRFIDLLTLAGVIHNAFQLSNAVLQTCVEVVENVIQFFGFKDDEGNPIDVLESIGETFNGIMGGLLGEDKWLKYKAEWAKYNRIYQAGANVLNSITDTMDGLYSLNEQTATMTGRIGNSLKRFQLVGENAYDWMSENFANFRTGRWKNLVRVVDGLTQAQEVAEAIEDVSGTILSTAQSLQEAKENAAQFQKILEEMRPENPSPYKSKENRPSKEDFETVRDQALAGDAAENLEQALKREEEPTTP